MRTLAIIGSHPRTRATFDFDRTDCDVWLFNEAISNPVNRVWAKRATAIFQMHIPTIWKNPQNRNDPKHYEWLQTQTECDVWMQDVYPDVPRSKKYPLDGILDMIGHSKEHFLTSSVPQAMALAAYLGIYDRIEIYGVAMETNTEYGFQREGVAFWLGYLRGHGITVDFVDVTFVAPLYGYEGEVFIKYERFGERVEELKPQIEELSGKYKVALETFKLFVDQFDKNGATTQIEKNLFEGVQTLRTLGDQLGTLDGAMQENERYRTKADEMRVASGGEFVFSRQEFESGAKSNFDKANQFKTQLNVIGTELNIIHSNIMKSAKGSPKREKFFGLYRQRMQDYLNCNNAAGIHVGASKENYEYMSYLDRHIKAAGGSKAEEAILEALQTQKAEALNV